MSLLDRFISEVDHGLRTVFAKAQSNRDNPAASIDEAEFSDAEQKKINGLMRIDHCGEICAQALYRGQALVAKNKQTRVALHKAADEENDHLAWCGQRLGELDGHQSYFNPIWYAGSFIIGATVGLVGDAYSFGFVAETERQVERHLEEHLKTLPASDKKSQAILAQMKIDEAEHATAALHAGGKDLPKPVKFIMRCKSKIMTNTAYYF